MGGTGKKQSMMMKKDASTLVLLLCAAVIVTANVNTEMEHADNDIDSLHLWQMEQAHDAIIPEPTNVGVTPEEDLLDPASDTFNNRHEQKLGYTATTKQPLSSHQ